MTLKTIIFSLIEALLWYCFLLVGIDVIRNKRNIWLSSLILLVLGYLAFIACPWFRNTQAWEQMF